MVEPDAGAAPQVEHELSGIRPPEPEVVVHRIIEIVRRYLPCEIAGAVTAVVSGSVAFAATASPVWGALGATLGENVGYYGIAAVSAWRRERPDAPHARAAVARCARSLVTEFGPAEVVDTLIARPLLMLAAATLMHSAPTAWLVGKLTADVVFYAIVIGCWRVASSRVRAPGKL